MAAGAASRKGAATASGATGRKKAARPATQSPVAGSGSPGGSGEGRVQKKRRVVTEKKKGKSSPKLRRSGVPRFAGTGEFGWNTWNTWCTWKATQVDGFKVEKHKDQYYRGERAPVDWILAEAERRGVLDQDLVDFHTGKRAKVLAKHKQQSAMAGKEDEDAGSIGVAAPLDSEDMAMAYGGDPTFEVPMMTAAGQYVEEEEEATLGGDKEDDNLEDDMAAYLANMD
ncbi:hypothetical protein GPECTOR_140g686 [Gonium pectorale]|uniref:Uncharacterized protein n=1 Tax=Gonium pectorale TaxID=33097 RepID=A0A150FZL8_GONPE|nr:hypothetical protein GPECTOR_140g686 [Gonium pectorale]|eukprot:KXZ42510.1 hypothetical protein GPECTOR_140g686 [Gonium pectorale]